MVFFLILFSLKNNNKINSDSKPIFKMVFFSKIQKKKKPSLVFEWEHIIAKNAVSTLSYFYNKIKNKN